MFDIFMRSRISTSESTGEAGVCPHRLRVRVSCLGGCARSINEVIQIGSGIHTVLAFGGCGRVVNCIWLPAQPPQQFSTYDRSPRRVWF